MESTFIIIRGNAASGKTTAAKLLHEQLGGGNAVLISQDVVRREMLGVKDTKENLAINLIKNIAMYGKECCHYVILEGIFKTTIYNELFTELYDLFEHRVFAYYFDISFQETLSRHKKREKSQEFGEEAMKRWWIEKDLLNRSGEYLFTKDQSEKEIVSKILNDIG